MMFALNHSRQFNGRLPWPSSRGILRQISGEYFDRNPAHTQAMAYDESLEKRIRQFFDGRRIKYEEKRMMGGLCFMVNGKMCLGVEKSRLMARIGPEAYDDALKRTGWRPLGFTVRPIRWFGFVRS